MLNISSFTGGIAQTNGYLVRAEDGAALVVDAPSGMADWLERQGVKVGGLLLTHQHFDHVEDAARIKAGHGCRLHAFAPYSRDLTLEVMFGIATGTVMSVQPFEVDEVLEGRESVAVAGMAWKLAHIPGHSPDSVIFVSQEERLVFGGDVLFEDGIGRCDFPGGSMELLLEGIQSKLMPLGDDFALYPGHGPSTTLGRERQYNPYLDE